MSTPRSHIDSEEESEDEEGFLEKGGVVEQNSEPLDAVTDLHETVTDSHDPLLRNRKGGQNGVHSSLSHPHHYRRFDSRVGFMGKDSPAGFLPSRAMTLSNTMRFQDDKDGAKSPLQGYEGSFGGDDGL